MTLEEHRENSLMCRFRCRVAGVLRRKELASGAEFFWHRSRTLGYDMKLSSLWIRDFVDVSVDDRRLAEDLTNVGISVEGIIGSGADTVFEMEIGTNRPDAMNHYGVAREAAAIYEVALKPLSAVSSQLSAAAEAADSPGAGNAALKGRSSTVG